MYNCYRRARFNRLRKILKKTINESLLAKAFFIALNVSIGLKFDAKQIIQVIFLSPANYWMHLNE